MIICQAVFLTEKNIYVATKKVDTFLRAKAGETGNAAVCIGDYTFAEGFNPKIKMIRHKTLTLGHAYCNLAMSGTNRESSRLHKEDMLSLL